MCKDMDTFRVAKNDAIEDKRDRGPYWMCGYTINGISDLKKKTPKLYRVWLV